MNETYILMARGLDYYCDPTSEKKALFLGAFSKYKKKFHIFDESAEKTEKNLAEILINAPFTGVIETTKKINYKLKNI